MLSVQNAKKCREIMQVIRQKCIDNLALLNSTTYPPVNGYFTNVNPEQFVEVANSIINEGHNLASFTHKIKNVSNKYIINNEYFIDIDTKYRLIAIDEQGDYILRLNNSYIVMKFEELEQFNKEIV